MCISSMKTIKVKEKNWKKLVIMKVNLAARNLDEVIERLIKISQAIKRGEKIAEASD